MLSTITVTASPYATPTFTSGGSQCIGTSQTLAVTSDPSATGYQWNIPDGFSPSGLVTTTAPTISITAPVLSVPSAYSITCQAVYNNPSCPVSPAARVSFQVLTAQIVDFAAGQRDANGNVCIGRRMTLRLVPGTGSVSNISWSIASGSIIAGQGTDVADFRTPSAGGVQVAVTAQFQDGCGGPSFVYYHARTVDAGTTYLDNGYGCDAAPQRPFPNPADGSFTLTGIYGACVLYNSHGQPVARYIAHEPGKSSVVDTRALPSGFYALVGTSAAGEPLHYTLQLQH
ncbi:hypothetical protein [Hymenobacter terricola]|uniref:hypothetical protein n=1 Tax=Hymenobacter terricola TaxID=2819236 RepID=UPI001B3147F0|nr:hypothetical protein [Hymenobacter terricola]